MAPPTLRSIQSERITLFDGVTVTSAYSDNVSRGIEIGGTDQLTFFLEWNADSNGDNLDVQFEVSPNGTDWYIIPTESASAGVVTLADAIYRLDGPTAGTEVTSRVAIPVAEQYVRASLKSVGNAGTASLFMVKSGV